MQKDDAAWRNTSQVVKLKIHLLQHLFILQSWYNVTTNATWKLCLATKIVLLLDISTCRKTSFESLRYIHLSLRQCATYQTMTSKPYSLSYFEHRSKWYFSIYSLWRYIIVAYISKATRNRYVQHRFSHCIYNTASSKCKHNFLTRGCNRSSWKSIWLSDYSTIVQKIVSSKSCILIQP